MGIDVHSDRYAGVTGAFAGHFRMNSFSEEAGDIDGCAVWMRVIGAIKELLDQQPPNSDTPLTLSTAIRKTKVFRTEDRGCPADL